MTKTTEKAISAACTDGAEIAKECEAAFRVYNSWGLSKDELLTHVFYHGNLDYPDRKHGVNGMDDKPGDLVWRAPNGSEMTRHMALHWYEAWGPFESGYMAAVRNAHSKRNA